MGHLTEMGDHRVGVGLQFATAPMCSGTRSEYGWEIGPRCRRSEIARQCGAAVGQERPSGKPGGLFLFSSRPAHRATRSGTALLRGKGDRRAVIVAGSHGAVGEDLVLCDPVE